MDKPFRTIEEQVGILNSRGVATDGDTTEILSREGYYSVVNGYRDLYLDREATAKAGEDVFDEGTTFKDIYRLFLFDRALRQTLFKYFAIAEATLKTMCAYSFMEAHQDEKEPYLDKSNYDDAQPKFVGWLIEDFESALGRNPKKRPKPKAYMEHYRQNHDEVPLWVLLRYMTLGQTFKFYCYQNESMRNRIAKGFAELHEQSYGRKITVSPKRLKKAYDHIKDFRNICAHEERLYCARISPARDVTVADVLPDLRLVLSKRDADRLTSDVAALLVDAGNDMEVGYFRKMMESMGFGNIQEIMGQRES